MELICLYLILSLYNSVKGINDRNGDINETSPPSPNVYIGNRQFPNTVYDVIIVGGGLSGLSAARFLCKKISNIKILVLEGRSRLGGRIKSISMKATNGTEKKFDIGSQWIGPRHHELNALLSEFGIDTVKQKVCGKTTIMDVNIRIHKREIDLEFPITGKLNLSGFITEPRARELNSYSIAEYFATHHLDSQIKHNTNRLLQTLFDAPAHDVSALQIPITTSSDQVDLTELLLSTGHGGSYIAENGLQTLIDKLAEGIEVELNSNVIRVTDNKKDSYEGYFNTSENENEVIIETTKKAYRARDVIIAIPPLLVSQMAFEPHLILSQQQLFCIPLYNDYRPRGHAYTFVVTYESPFWNKDHRNGHVIYSDPTGKGPLLWLTTFDASRYVNNDDTCCKFFCCKFNFFTVKFNHDKQWFADKFSRGFVGVFGPKQIPPSLFSLLADSHGNRVHFAGAEFSSKSIGLMNGAVASARTAVERVVNNKIQRGELSPMILLPPSSISINAENFSNGIDSLKLDVEEEIEIINETAIFETPNVGTDFADAFKNIESSSNPTIIEMVEEMETIDEADIIEIPDSENATAIDKISDSEIHMTTNIEIADSKNNETTIIKISDSETTTSTSTESIPGEFSELMTNVYGQNPPISFEKLPHEQRIDFALMLSSSLTLLLNTLKAIANDTAVMNSTI
ncbi:unnamed protein product [Dracunculus medinensis]|uniref:Amine oxidase n=1 Tax=Dracunculus medinensis TaxID=318479 RepID=A0A0N4UMS5_DRAME|nr:unnamed protein product [Dracunculus medinensis]